MSDNRLACMSDDPIPHSSSTNHDHLHEERKDNDKGVQEKVMRHRAKHNSCVPIPNCMCRVGKGPRGHPRSMSPMIGVQRSDEQRPSGPQSQIVFMTCALHVK